MDAMESAARMIADDAVRMAKDRGASGPEEVEINVDRDLGDVTEAMVREYIREAWDASD